ncbi:polyprenyl synthetase family protein [Actinomadura viridis]|uniref:Geranylgeranyl diphosphate synthase type I n=1 Tax=Actinomadura viridis TaxID=58110 RepID=A0A931DQA1_9ACTN|nr:polyprenyl synthetase family protein [Actinomadura viridis]MBG6091816.1 geranylgeranyl diphosphate synthase type I [Actinomadura viridis]
MTAQAPAAVSAGRELLEPALRATVDRLDRPMREIASYHFGWTDETGAPVPPALRSTGKALRPALVLLAARAADDDPRPALPGAVAVELVHAFSLLHDDIMDGDRTRRHRPAAWTVFGTPAAILCGDALLALSHEVLLETGTAGGHRAARALAGATARLITGQALDLEFERRARISLAECLRMAAGKTAALLACSCSLGPLLCEAPEPLPGALAAFGSDLGVAFQLTDDLLGIWGAPEVTGKPAGNDLRARKKSLPVTAALNAGTAESERLAEVLGRPGVPSEADVREAARLVEAAGGRAWTEAEAAARVASARAHLDGVDMPDRVRADLLELADYVTTRSR